MAKRKTLKEFIAKSNLIHNYKYDYAKSSYFNNYTKLIIICKEHGEFLQNPNSHLRGVGCLKCAGFNLSNLELIERFNKIHYHKYDYSKFNYTSAKHKSIIICQEHEEFEQTANKHLQGRGCPKCVGKKLTIQERILKFKKIHGNTYDYSKFRYNGNKEKSIFICLNHGDFEQTPSNHLNGFGCIKCGGTEQKTTEIFIKESTKIHGDKYNYSLAKYKTCFSKLKIICKSHGIFEQFPSNHMRGSGCPKCCGRNLTAKEWISRFNKFHNYRYNYSKFKFLGCKEKSTIICHKHGEFEQTPSNHLGHGCHKCSSNVSQLEKDWIDSFEIDIKHQEAIYIDKKIFKVDGFDKKSNTIYEFYGDFWHGNPKVYNSNDINLVNKKTFGFLYKETLKRENLLKKFGYKIVSIWENEWLLKLNLE